MPINSIQNISTKVVKTLIQRPHLLVFMYIIILLFPLELIDYLLYYLVNFFIMILNILIFILVGLYNIIVGFLVGIINWAIIQLFLIINYLIGLLGFGTVSTPVLSGFDVVYPTMAYKEFNLFGEAKLSPVESAGSVIPYNSLFGYILSLFGLTAPIW